MAFVCNAEYIQDNERYDDNIKLTYTLYNVCSSHFYIYHTFLCIHTTTVIVDITSNRYFSWHCSVEPVLTRSLCCLQCVPVGGLGFRRGSYRCECQNGFYFPINESAGDRGLFFNGSEIERQFDSKMRVRSDAAACMCVRVRAGMLRCF